MTINYNRVNWDTTKFVNPTNMNQMDAGIKAACDALDNTVGEKSDLPNPSKTVTENILSLSQKVVPLTLKLDYYSATQLRGTFTPTPIPNGYTYRSVLYMPTVPYNELGNKMNGKFMKNGNTIIAVGSGFVSGESHTIDVLVIFS